MSPGKPITIIGGGLAGLTLGIGLRQLGAPVTIWEAGRYPRHRVCGEFISGNGQAVLQRFGLLARFEQGLDTPVTAGGAGVRLGQKQLIAFMRAVLREPEILVLDEATANIDTVTEQLLEQILRELPATTTKVVIAHRLNTIENADEIFFINGEEITPA